MLMQPTYTCFGAAQRVTGSKHLITSSLGTKILLDCGLVQGEGAEGDELNRHWGFEPSSIDCVILSHAHIDHTGLLPRLVRDGFSGPIYCNSATKDLCNMMLLDSAHIQETDLMRINKRRLARGEDAIEPLYTEKDVIQTLSQMAEVVDESWFSIDELSQFQMIPNAHILGSGCIHLSLNTINEKTITLTYTGDIGRPNDQILEGPFPFPPSDYIICESTYGNRLHLPSQDAKEPLLELINHICVEKQGKIIIPAFSIDRTQEIIFLLDQLEHEDKLPEIKVYVDSPLSVKATQVMALHRESFNPSILDYISRDGDPFAFHNLHYVSKLEESKAINEEKQPSIIISASGMADAGRVKHHIANNIENPNCAILLVGYASPRSLAGQLIEGREEVKIFGDVKKVRAEIHRMDNFSAHADWKEMCDYLLCQDPSKVKKLFLVHGEPSSMSSFETKLNNLGFSDVEPAKMGVSHTLI
jgi:metallo-beta-lactamase family protein